MSRNITGAIDNEDDNKDDDNNKNDDDNLNDVAMDKDNTFIQVERHHIHTYDLICELCRCMMICHI